jgi:very-short-patch-repair endonuclease
MRVSSSYSVGVVAVNKEQRDLIQELLDRAIAEDEEAQRYVSKWDGTLYPYFVKNLESVQGDERDVMFISTVYGPEAIGGRVAQRFGPILGAAGWRRLNVLFTRARIRVELFTSMRPSDIRTEEGRSSRGLVAFRDYLEYAHMGRLEKGVVTARPPDSDFEIAVGRMLEAHGYEVVPQVGVDKYYVDLAVRHPRHGGFLIGIECDGATYHSSRSARDRDRTREEALIGLGWSLYRIWSTDWFANPGREFEKLDSRLRKLLSVSQS